MNLNIEAIRTLLEFEYNRSYRFTKGERRNLLDLLADVLAPEIEAEAMGGPEVELKGDWLRRFVFGYWRKSDGHYVYTIPRPERLELIIQFLQELELMLPFILAEHQGDAEDAQTIRQERGYNYADARLLAGTFRGLFYGESHSGNESVKTSLLIYLIPGECVFRVRFLRGSPDRLVSSDMFAAFGTNFGTLYDGSASVQASDFAFISKGRRVNEMSLEDAGGGTRLVLCQQPEDINAALDLWRLAGEQRLKHAYTPSPRPVAAE